MERREIRLIGLVMLAGVLVCLSVYAEKEHKAKLPEPVAAAVQDLYPQGKIEEVQKDRESIMLYEIEVTQDGQEYELSIAPDGTIVEEEQEIAVQDLPQVIQDAIAGSDVEEVTKEVTYWVVTLTKLETPEISYSVELKQDGKESEMEFSANGTLQKQQADDDDGDDDGDDDDDDDENDDNEDDD